MKNKKELKEQYFAIRDAFYTAGTGFTKVECHDILKRSIFPLLADEEENWELDEHSEETILKAISPSLNWLSEKGLIKFIEQCKSFINDNFKVGV